MRRKLLRIGGVLFLTIFGMNLGFAQDNWQWQNPDIQGNTLSDVQFVTSDTVYAVGDLGLVLKSEDGGQTWTDVSVETTKDFYTVHFVSVDTGWVVGSWYTSGGGGTESLFKTTDGGQTWKVQFAGSTIYDMYFTDADTGYAAGEDDLVQKTTDGGQTWDAVHESSGFDGEALRSLSVRDSVIWAVGTNGKMISSADYGQTWTTHDPGVSLNFNSIAFRNATEGFVVGGEYGSSGDVGFMMHTTDAGSTWTKIDRMFHRPLQQISFADDSRGWAVGGKVDFYSNETYPIEYEPDSSNYILSTDDGGETWDARYVNHGPQVWYSIAWGDQMNGIVVGTGGQIGQTSDGGNSWTTNSATGSNFRDVLFISDQVGWAVAGSNHHSAIYHTDDGGETWARQQVDLDTLQSLHGINFTDANTGWAVGEDQWWEYDWVLLKTTDCGETWTTVDPGIAETPFPLTKVQFVNDNEGWISGDGSLMHTTDGGDSWSLDTTGLGSNDVYFADSQHGWAVNDDGEILATSDGAVTWTVQREADQFIHDDLFSVYFVNTDSGWAAGDRGTVLFTSDGGENWEELSTGIYTDFFTVTFITSDVGWVAGDGYILGTTDAGQTWEYFDEVTTNSVNDIFFLDKETGWFAGNHGTLLSTSNGGGIVTGIEDASGGNKNVPARFTLKQNYPNPFNPSTTIAYTLPREAEVSVTVYNVLGNHVATLINQYQEAGEYSVRWNGWNATGEHVGAGVYFYRVSAGEYEQTKKMVLLK